MCSHECFTILSRSPPSCVSLARARGGGTKAELSLAPSAADGLLQSLLLYFSTHFAFHETTMIIVAKKCK